jgi:hypothetical protein
MSDNDPSVRAFPAVQQIPSSALCGASELIGGCRLIFSLCRSNSTVIAKNRTTADRHVVRSPRLVARLPARPDHRVTARRHERPRPHARSLSGSAGPPAHRAGASELIEGRRTRYRQRHGRRVVLSGESVAQHAHALPRRALLALS